MIKKDPTTADDIRNLPLRLVRPHPGVCETDEPEKRDH